MDHLLCKILCTLLKLDQGGTQTDRPKNKADDDDDDAQGLTLKR